MKIDELQNAMTAEFKKFLPALQTCRMYSGRFDLQELDAISVKAPALLISFLGIKGIEEAGDARVDLTCQFAAYLVTTDCRELKRDVAAKNMTEAITVWLPNRRFGVQDVGVPEGIGATNLYDGNVRSKGVALAAVSWEQKVRTGSSVFKDDGVLPEDVYAGTGGDYTKVTGDE
jgi:hypothetical protein